ncbi:MAG: CHASE2 domain-containing protein [Candidatus Binatia bacterium]
MKFKKPIRPLIIGSALAAFVFLSYEHGFLAIAELKSLDWRFRIRGAVRPQMPIVLVSIDQDSFDELDLPWPWPRTLHAALIHNLAKGQPRLIGFDILIAEPKADPQEDLALAQAIKKAGNVILAAEYTEVQSNFGPKMSMSLPHTLIREHALGYGPVNMEIDQDGIVRSAKLALPFQKRTYPSFAYRIYQASAGKMKRTGEEALPVSYLINFRGPARSYPIVPYYRILREEIDPSFFRDKIVLVGSFAPSLHDTFPTPFSATQPMAGVEIQANFIGTLMAKDPIIHLANMAHSAIFLLFVAMTVWFSLQLKPLRAFALVLALALVHAIAALFFFSKYQLWIPLVPPLLGILLSYAGVTLDNYIREQKERIRLRTTFGKYVSPEVVEEILRDREGLGLSGKRRHITVLFSDIRDFTSISEQIGPEKVVSLLSDYLGRVTDLVFKNGGTVDKFIGDAIMAIFGAPKSYEDDALRAVKTGLDMIELADSMGPDWAKRIGRPLKIGVGINSGEAVVGSIGSEIRSDFTAIGDTVNLASRLEGLTKELGVPMLISEFTASELKGSVSLRPLRQVKVAGREASLLVYTTATLAGSGVEFEADTRKPFTQQPK